MAETAETAEMAEMAETSNFDEFKKKRLRICGGLVENQGPIQAVLRI